MKKTIKLIFLTLFIWVAFSLISIVNAATATIKPSKSTVYVGDDATVTVTVKAAAWNLQVSGSASGSIIGYNADAENETTTKTYTIDTSKAGSYTVKLSGDITDESKDTADIINKSTTITVKNKETTTDKKEDEDKTTTTDKTTSDKDTTTDKKDEVTTQEQTKEKSNNAYLNTLGVRISDSLAKEIGVKVNEYDFSGFSKTKTSYNVTIPKNVDSLKVFATPADSNATVKVSGNSGFEVGSNNKITVKVTAEDGKTTKTYTIKVTKLAEEEEKPGNLIEDNEGLYLTSLEIDGVEISPKFVKDTYSYTGKVSSDTTEVNIKTVSNNENAKIDISGNKDLLEGENTVNIILTLDDSEEQAVYQVILNKEAEEFTTTTSISENNQEDTTDLIGTVKKYVGIVVAVVLLLVITVIVLIVLLRKENKRLNEEDEEIDEANNREYNVYKNDENEFANNDIKKDNFIESLYKQRSGTLDEEDLTEEEKETLEEINKQTEKIFTEKVEGQSVEYSKNEFIDENPLEVRRKRRGKGKHSL